MQEVLYILPFLIVLYYLWANWSYLKSQPAILGILLVGTLLLLVSILAYANVPKYLALARFAGLLLILIGIGIIAFKNTRTRD